MKLKINSTKAWVFVGADAEAFLATSQINPIEKTPRIIAITNESK